MYRTTHCNRTTHNWTTIDIKSSGVKETHYRANSPVKIHKIHQGLWLRKRSAGATKCQRL